MTFVKFNICHYIQSNFSKIKNFKFNLPSNQSRHREEHFHIKNYLFKITPSQGKQRLKRRPLNCSHKWSCTFPHSYAASFLRKVILCETNIFRSPEYEVWHKLNAIFIKNEVQVTLDGFRNFAYVSSYLHLITFAQKRDCVISKKLQMIQT